MLEGERPPILTDEHIISEGRKEYYRYRVEAQNSSIPEAFLEVSSAITLDNSQELSSKDVAELVFETKFESDQDAWLAIKYAEAIAAIKSFESNIDSDSDGPIITKEALDNVYLRIGVAILNEPVGEEAEIVKLTVEEYFETHPFAFMRMKYIAKELDSGKVH